jgi:hypothetical protein
MRNGYVIEGGAEGNGSVLGQGGNPQPQGAPHGGAQGPYPHPVPAPQAGAGGAPPNGTAPSGGYPQTLLPSGSQVVSYVDRAATKIPWWTWVIVGAVAYRYVFHRPAWKGLKGL